VVRTDEPLIVLVDPVVSAVVPPGASRETAMDPESSPEGIHLPGIPRDLTFVVGVPYLVSDELAQAREWTTELLTAEELEAQGIEEHVVTTLAYVTDLNGNLYVLDAENHRPIDRSPFVGATASIPGYTTDGVTLHTEVVQECADREDCEYPVLADYNKIYDGSTVTDPIYYGVWVQTAATRSEDWVLRWQGTLPGTGRSLSGRFEGWRFKDERSAVDFQALGAQVGDFLSITSEPLPAADGSGGVHPACSPGSGAEDTAQARSYFRVLAIEPAYLTLEAVEGMDPGVCWPEAVRYEVRASQEWTVWSSLDGLVGRVALSPRQASSPVPPVYDNGRIALTIYEPAPDADGNPRTISRGSAFGFGTDSGFLPGMFAPAVSMGFSGRLVSLDVDDTAAEPGARVDDRIYALYEGSDAMLEFFPASLESTNYIVYQ
jgi:hypothetical protein